MAVCLAVCEIFTVKERCDLENRVIGFVRGHWKWHHLIDQNWYTIRHYGYSYNGIESRIMVY